MSALIDGLLYAWKKNSDYGQQLVADIPAEKMALAAPVDVAAPANHPAWILSHLNVYHPIIAALIEDREFPDPREHRYGMLSQPEPNLDAYPAKDQLVNAFVSGHQVVETLLREKLSADGLERSVRLQRWSTTMPRVGIALPYLMLHHEGLHLGQLSAWRRFQGFSRV